MATKTIKLTGEPVDLSRFPVDAAISAAVTAAAAATGTPGARPMSVRQWLALAVLEKLTREGWKIGN